MTIGDGALSSDKSPLESVGSCVDCPMPNRDRLTVIPTKFNIRFFGHAYLKVGESGACLMDPWFSRQGAFFESWFQFPENHHLRSQALASVKDLLISYNHGDHFEAETLLLALRDDPDVLIHIQKLGTDWFKQRAKQELS
jgi:L-ascorbate metabolism protein UlaG (beta-lactamase superfamily)